MSEQHKYVTTAELDKKLDEKPSKYEVRYLIVLAIIANQVLPTVDVAKAAAAAAIGVVW